MQSGVVIQDDLIEYEFVFWFDDRNRTFVLDAYYKRERATRRHSFKAIEYWNRVDKRARNIEKPFVSSCVKQQALDNFVSSLKIEA